MSSQQHNASLLDLEPDTIIELYEIDLGEQEGIYRFHPGKNNLKDIMLSDDFGNLNTYYSLPIEATNFELKGDGTLPRPKLMIANPQGLLSDAIKRRDDLIGHSIVRKRIFLKFLDHENFPNNLNPFAIPDPQARFDDDIYKINRKTQENKFYIEFELVSPLEMEGANIPARMMLANYCPWQYRGVGCLYGKRPDHTEQSITLPDGTVHTPASFFANINQNISNDGPNLGIPLADENNKLFAEENGYNLNLKWQGDYNPTTSTVTVNGAVNEIDIVTSTLNNKSLVIINNAAGYSSGATQFNVTANVDIANGKTISFNNGATITLTSAVTGDPDNQQTIYGTLTGGDLNDLDEGFAPQSITISSQLGVALSIGDIITFNDTTSFVLDEAALVTDITLSGNLSASIPISSNGQAIQTITVDALTAPIEKSKNIVFSSGTILELTSDAEEGDTQLFGILIGNLADDETGFWKYLPGDVVRIKSQVVNLSKFGINNEQESLTNKPDLFFVCIKEATADKDPRYEQEYWVMDQCAKNLTACKFRYRIYGAYKNGLPFGGFPATDRYDF